MTDREKLVLRKHSQHRITTLSILPSAAVGTADGPPDTIEAGSTAARALTSPSSRTCTVSARISCCPSELPSASVPHHRDRLTRHASSARDIDNHLCSPPSTTLPSPPSWPAALARYRCPPIRRSSRARAQRPIDICDTGEAPVRAHTCRGGVRAPMLRRRKPRARAPPSA